MKNKKLFAILTLVCFMLTLMPVAAFAAGPVDPATSALVLADGAVTNLRISSSTTGTTESTLVFDLRDNGSDPTTDLGNKTVYVWAVDSNGTKSSAMNPIGNESDIAYVYEVDDPTQPVVVSFARTGTYTVYAGIGTNATSLSDITKLTGDDAVTFTVNNINNPDGYVMTLDGPKVVEKPANVEKDYDAYIATITPDNVSDEYTVTITSNGKPVSGKTVKIEAGSANITVSQQKANTTLNGVVKFDLSASREGVYSVYVTVDNKMFEIYVNASNTAAAYIETSAQPTKAQAQFETSPSVSFKITDINGNIFAGNSANKLPAGQGADGILGVNEKKDATKYLFFTEKPAASALNDGDLSLTYNASDLDYDLTINGVLDAEGTYSVKVILDNGAVATATWTVKAFQTPVSMYFSSGVPAQVELGRVLVPTVTYVDANGTEKEAKADVTVSATGYAIQETSGTYAGAKTYTINLKTDEKYVGSTIDVTAVSERYNLVCTNTVTIAQPTAIAFEDVNLAVNANNKVKWNVVDADGKIVRVNNVQERVVRYVVLDKPVDAKVSIYDTTKAASAFNGEGEMNITSDKVGNVTVQVVCQVTIKQNATNTTNQTKYYTGTKIFAVGTEGVGDVVVMSIGSNEIVINDKKATIDAAPIVQNDRTYVPFRALAEAFGAEVAYDEATQAVTAELNGVTVVMTIGSATYTVNGAEKTMDVAPFINGSRTMVPVRFVAEAFGIKVIPTYDENGATADILFNL